MKTTESVNQARATVDIVVPTWNNPQIFGRMLASLFAYTSEPFRLIIVNNGDASNLPKIPDYLNVVLLQSDKNLGWMGGVNGGVKWALAHDPAKFLMWVNDDVQVLPHDFGWLTKMIRCFEIDGVGAVGPTSNAIMGQQSIGMATSPPQIEATQLSGMCLLTKSDIVRKVGLLDESLPGGDDLDYSIRLRLAGFKLCICRRAFLLHHYATTGRRIHGDYWDSREHSEAINQAIIRKHGLKVWYVTTNNLFQDGGYDFVKAEETLALGELQEDLEQGLVLDLGCGGKKIHPKAVGVDIRPEGVSGVGVNANIPSSGDVSCDVTELNPFADKSVDAILAKHLLEHVLDVPRALKNWGRVLKDGGKLVIICPDYRYCEAISVDPSHVHAFTPETIKSTLESVGGWKVTRTEQVSPGYVFMVSAEKVPVLEAVAA